MTASTTAPIIARGRGVGWLVEGYHRQYIAYKHAIESDTQHPSTFSDHIRSDQPQTRPTMITNQSGVRV